MRTPRRVIVPTLLLMQLAVVAVLAQARPALRIVVIAGEDAVNVIQQKTAVAPIVEVRDRNDVPVAGVPVTFAIAGANASFGGAPTVTVTTNAAGRAVASGLTPVGNGPLQIQVSASFQGQTAAATISQTNVATAPAGSSAGAKAGGGGISGLAIAGISAVVIGGGAAVALGASKDDSTSTSSTTTTTPTAATPPAATPAPAPPPPSNRAPVVSTPTATRSATIPGIPVTFSASATDAEGDALTYAWDFGDGNTSTEVSPTYTFQRSGVFMVRVVVRDRESAANAEAPIHVKSVTGVWDYLPTAGDAGDFTLNQSGTMVTGTQLSVTQDAAGRRLSQVDCPVTGTIQATLPHVILTRAQCTILGATLRFDLSADADTLTLISPRPDEWRRR
jgi:PKD repeat protein